LLRMETANIIQFLTGRTRRRIRNGRSHFDRTARKVGMNGDDLKRLYFAHYATSMDSAEFCRLVLEGRIQTT
jgi:hypothetical protein